MNMQHTPVRCPAIHNYKRKVSEMPTHAKLFEFYYLWSIMYFNIMTDLICYFVIYDIRSYTCWEYQDTKIRVMARELIF